jgi:phage gp29-like protein
MSKMEELSTVHVVVNHLHLREPLTEPTVRAAEAVLQRVVDAGALAAQLAKVDETHLILVLTFPGQEDADRVARDVGGPWMREHIAPLLARATDRSVAKVIAAA